jgi:hypothetical protein
VANSLETATAAATGRVRIELSTPEIRLCPAAEEAEEAHEDVRSRGGAKSMEAGGEQVSSDRARRRLGKQRSRAARQQP